MVNTLTGAHGRQDFTVAKAWLSLNSKTVAILYVPFYSHHVNQYCKEKNYRQAKLFFLVQKMVNKKQYISWQEF